MTASEAAVQRIEGFKGEVVRPGDPGYDVRRTVWNAMHDRRPALIARCTSMRDVAAAIAYGRERAIPIAVRGGGHSMPGHSTCDDGIVIDLRPMNGVSVDAGARTVTVQGGALLGELDRATQRHRLVVPAGVVSHTGVAGLTLGGGVGRLMRRFGLTSTVSCAPPWSPPTVASSDASAAENPDLFWGICGAAAATSGWSPSSSSALHELTQLEILATFHPLERAPDVLARGRQRHGRGSRPTSCCGRASCARRPRYRGSRRASSAARGHVADRVVGRPRTRAGALLESEGRARADRRVELETVPFLEIQTLTDEIFAAGKRTYIKAGFATELTDDLIEHALPLRRARLARSSPRSRCWRSVARSAGSHPRPPPSRTATRAWLINLPATWEEAASTGEEIAWVRRHASRRIEPHLTGGKYVNFMGEDEEADSGGAYGATLRRLREVKRAYDPDNVFRLNQNVAP